MKSTNRPGAHRVTPMRPLMGRLDHRVIANNLRMTTMQKKRPWLASLLTLTVLAWVLLAMMVGVGWLLAGVVM